MLHLLIWLLTGALVGWIASLIMHTKGGLIRNIIIGLVGGALGGWLATALGLHATGIGSILISIVGACLLIWLGSKLFKKS